MKTLSEEEITLDIEPYVIYRGKDVKEFIKNCERRIIEVINMEWDKGMEYVLGEVKEIIREESGDKLICNQK